MFPFWEKVVAPILEVADVKRIVEIGALRGENTRQILDTVGPHAELHVIDPVPDFDPVEHAKQFGGQYIFHRDLSVNVLGDLPPMDAALIDGDHNWFTVYNECKLLAQSSRAAGAPLPVMVFHDVCWPYGRRDLYYDPSNIPAEHRHEWQQRGMWPGRSELMPSGGLNPTMANAVTEGGPRNGVMTGVDDFVAEHPEPLRVMVLPIYFGLAIVVEEERLARQPELARFLDHLESNEGKDMLLELAESMRIDAMLFQHHIYFQKEEQIDALADRYLDSVKRGLTGRHGSSADTAQATVPGGPGGLDQVQAALDTIRHDNVRGGIVTTGVGRGGAAVFVRAYLDAHPLHGRDLLVVERHGGHGALRRTLDDFGLLDGRTQFVTTDPAALSGAAVEQIALLHIGADTGADTAAVLETFYERLAPDAFVVVEDADDPQVRAALDTFRSAHGVTDIETRVGDRGTSWRRRKGFVPGSASASDPALASSTNG